MLILFRKWVSALLPSSLGLINVLQYTSATSLSSPSRQTILVQVYLDQIIPIPINRLHTMWVYAPIPWSEPFQNNDFVSDGPFIFETENNLFMLVSSYTHQKRYAIGYARSVSKDVEGPWEICNFPLYDHDGGHGMIFKTLNHELKLAIHTPNLEKFEQLLLLPIREQGQFLEIG